MSETKSRLRVKQMGDFAAVEFVDHKILDELCIAELEEELFRLIDRSESGKLLLSFRNVGHFTSAALGMLLKLKKKVDEKNGALKLSDINPLIYEVFKITQLNKRFDIYDTFDKAKSSFAN